MTLSPTSQSVILVLLESCDNLKTLEILSLPATDQQQQQLSDARQIVYTRNSQVIVQHNCTFIDLYRSRQNVFATVLTVVIRCPWSPCKVIPFQAD
jgi:hypothetical protein